MRMSVDSHGFWALCALQISTEKTTDHVCQKPVSCFVPGLGTGRMGRDNRLPGCRVFRKGCREISLAERRAYARSDGDCHEGKLRPHSGHRRRESKGKRLIRSDTSKPLSGMGTAKTDLDALCTGNLRGRKTALLLFQAGLQPWESSMVDLPQQPVQLAKGGLKELGR